jgi:hypothetical protein
VLGWKPQWRLGLALAGGRRQWLPLQGTMTRNQGLEGGRVEDLHTVRVSKRGSAPRNTRCRNALVLFT